MPTPYEVEFIEDVSNSSKPRNIFELMFSWFWRCVYWWEQ